TSAPLRCSAPLSTNMAATMTVAWLLKPDRASGTVMTPVSISAVITSSATTSTRSFSVTNSAMAPARMASVNQRAMPPPRWRPGVCPSPGLRRAPLSASWPRCRPSSCVRTGAHGAGRARPPQSRTTGKAARRRPGDGATGRARAHNRAMDRYERILSLHRILKTARYPVTVARLREELECSRATVYRDLAFLRDALMAPVVGDGEAGFRYDADEAGRFELPGLWLNS